MHTPPALGQATLFNPGEVTDPSQHCTLVNAVSKNRASLPFIVPILYVTAAHCSVLRVSRGWGAGGLARVSPPRGRNGIKGPETPTSGARWAAGLRPGHSPGVGGEGTCRPPHPRMTQWGGHRANVLLNNTQRSSLTGSL